LLYSSVHGNSNSVFGNQFFELQNQRLPAKWCAATRVRSNDRFIEPVNVSNFVKFRKQLTLITLLSTAAGCVSNHQADRAAYSLVGTWSAQAEETIDAAGRRIASNPATGLLVYTPEGRVAVQIVVLPRPIVPAVPEGPGSVNEWDAGQARKVIETYDAYFGTYESDEVNHTVIHHVQGELRPNLDGSAFHRRYQIEGDRLTLRSTDPREMWQVVWKRVR
jgi:hypothetical protein